MTYHGHVKNGEITLDTPVRLPEGAAIKIEIVDAPLQGNGAGEPDSLRALLLRHAGRGSDLPDDLASHHDYYAHGKPIP